MWAGSRHVYKPEHLSLLQLQCVPPPASDTVSVLSLAPYHQGARPDRLAELQAKELWTSLHCLLANYTVISHAPVVLDEMSEHLFQQAHAEGNPTMCQELFNNTRLCLLHLPLPEQVVSAGLPWLRNYHLSPNDIVVTGFELPGSSNSSRCALVQTCSPQAPDRAVFARRPCLDAVLQQLVMLDGLARQQSHLEQAAHHLPARSNQGPGARVPGSWSACLPPCLRCPCAPCAGSTSRSTPTRCSSSPRPFPNMLWRQQSLEDPSEELRILENGRAPVIPNQPWWPGNSAASKHSHGKACSSLLWVHAVARSLRARVGSQARL